MPQATITTVAVALGIGMMDLRLLTPLTTSTMIDLEPDFPAVEPRPLHGRGASLLPEVHGLSFVHFHLQSGGHPGAHRVSSRSRRCTTVDQAPRQPRYLKKRKVS